MNEQAGRLQALLGRVQENRKQARGDATQPLFRQGEGLPLAESPAQPMFEPLPPAQPAPAARPPAPQPRAAAERPMRAPEPRPLPAAAKSTAGSVATPLEMALEGEVERAARESMDGVQPRVIASPEPGTPSRAIAQQVTKHPPLGAQSFGELLRRSLSLRPR